MAEQMGWEMAKSDREKPPSERTRKAAQRGRNRADDKSEARSGIYSAVIVLSRTGGARI